MDYGYGGNGFGEGGGGDAHQATHGGDADDAAEAAHVASLGPDDALRWDEEGSA